MEIDVLGKVAENGEPNMEKAVCYGCHQQIVIAWLNVKKTKCPTCHQVGRWYRPDVGAELPPAEEPVEIEEG